MLGFFRKRKTENIRDVIARQDYVRALEMIRAELVEKPGNRRLRLQQADLLILSGQTEEAVKQLEVLADELAMSGFPAQAIAILRRIKSVAPAREAVDDKLHRLANPGLRRERVGPRLGPPPLPPPQPEDLEHPYQVGGPRADEPMGSLRAPDPEEIRPLVTEPAERPPWVARTPAAPPTAPTPPAPESAPASQFFPDDDIELFDDESAFFFDGAGDANSSLGDMDDADIEITVEEDLEEYVKAESPAPAGPPATATALPVAPLPVAPLAVALAPVQAPLAVPRILSSMPASGLARLDTLPRESYEGGEIVVSEGEPGDCVYAIARGRVRVYVKVRNDRNAPLRTLGPGEVFGEIAALTGKKRTATVIAAEPCEVLRLERPVLDELMTEFPDVRTALYACFDERANDAGETAARGKKSRRTIPGRRKSPAPRARGKKTEA